MALIRKFAIVLIIISALSPATVRADTVDVSDITETLSLLPHMLYLPDPESRMTLENALASPDWELLTRSNHGYRKYPFWTQVRLTNGGDTPQTMILRNPRPGVNYLDVYVLSERHPLKLYALGNLRPAAELPILHRHSLLLLEIPSRETVTVVSRVRTMGSMELGWIISTVTDFSRYAVISSLMLGIFGGLMVTLLLYNLMVWRSLRDPAYLAYGAMAFFSLLFQYTIHGVFRVLDFGLPLKWIFTGGWMTSGFFMVAMSLFPILFFKTARTMPGVHKILLFATVYSGLFTILNFVHVYTQMALAYEILASSAIFLVSFLLFICGIQAARRRLPGAIYYLIGQGTYITAVVLQWLLILGPVTLNPFTEYTVIIGAAVDIIFLSFALGSRIKMVSEEKNTFQMLSLAQSRFTSVGKAVGAIIHQWKAPLARLGSQITELQGYLRHTGGGSPEFAAHAARILPNMARNLHDMGKTIDEFGRFYASGDEKKEFSPHELVGEVLDLLREKITAARTSVLFEGEWAGVRIFSYPRYFSHVVLTIMDNALDILKEQNVADAEIRLRLQTLGNSISLSIEDNGGGIRIKPVSDIFTPFVSHKNVRGSGLGLPIARMLTEEHLGGSIAVENTPRGARFILVLPNLNHSKIQAAH